MGFTSKVEIFSGMEFLLLGGNYVHQCGGCCVLAPWQCLVLCEVYLEVGGGDSPVTLRYTKRGEAYALD